MEKETVLVHCLIRVIQSYAKQKSDITHHKKFRSILSNAFSISALKYIAPTLDLLEVCTISWIAATPSNIFLPATNPLCWSELILGRRVWSLEAKTFALPYRLDKGRFSFVPMFFGFFEKSKSKLLSQQALRPFRGISKQESKLCISYYSHIYIQGSKDPDPRLRREEQDWILIYSSRRSEKKNWIGFNQKHTLCAWSVGKQQAASKEGGEWILDYISQKCWRPLTAKAAVFKTLTTKKESYQATLLRSPERIIGLGL